MHPAERARIAEDNLAQIERWAPSSDFDRKMRALNLRQVRRYLDAIKSP